MPHGNGCTPDELRAKLWRFKASDDCRACPRPILFINTDVKRAFFSRVAEIAGYPGDQQIG